MEEIIVTPIMSKRKWSVSKRWRRFAGLAGIGIVGLAVMVQINTPTHAQQTASKGSVGQPIAPTAMITVEAAEQRSVADMPSAAADLIGEGQPPRFLTDLPPAVYKAMKEQAAQGPARAGVRRPHGAEALAPPTLKNFSFNGVNQTVACNCIPPDPHGAVGKTHFVQVTNSHVDIYTTTVPQVLVKSVKLNTFFGEPILPGGVNFLFDPRVVYDPIWNRWIIIATRVSASAGDTVQKFRLAVSKTSNPAGSYYFTSVNFGVAGIQAGDWWDYPQLGFDQDAIFFTGNIFTFAGAYNTTAMLSIAKARMYNGLAYSSAVFTGLAPTLAPPIVQDDNADAYFVAANDGTTLHLYRGTNLSNPAEATLVLQANVPVTAYTAPPNAVQPGTAVLLDTGDRRFVNASSQVGDSLWNVHSIDVGGFSTPRFYQIDTEGAGANTLKQQGDFVASATSHDWNASIAANASDDAFVNWSSTDTTTQAQVRFSGRQPADPLGVIPAGVALFTSPTFYTSGLASGTTRWGDYSAVSLQPNANGTCAANQRAWIVNQKNNGNNTWGTRIGRIGFC
jgi:hypothetical protein